MITIINLVFTPVPVVPTLSRTDWGPYTYCEVWLTRTGRILLHFKRKNSILCKNWINIKNKNS